MQNIIFYVNAADTLGVIRDYSNQKNLSAPTLVRGVETCLKMRLFASGSGDTPYPLSSLSTATSWQFVMDRDFDSDTSYILEADDTISVASVTDVINDESLTFTELSIPISNMNTDALAQWLGSGEAKKGLDAELIGFGASGEQIFVLQLKGFPIRGRITQLGSPQNILPEYLTAAQVRALIAAGLAAQYSADAENWHDTQLDGDVYFRYRSASADSAPWCPAIKLPYGTAGTDGQDGADAYASVTKVGKQATIICGVSGGTETTVVVNDGQDGQDGQDGADAYASVSKVGKQATIVCGFSGGTETTVVVNDGEDGRDGQDGCFVTESYAAVITFNENDFSVYSKYSAETTTHNYTHNGEFSSDHRYDRIIRIPRSVFGYTNSDAIFGEEFDIVDGDTAKNYRADFRIETVWDNADYVMRFAFGFRPNRILLKPHGAGYCPGYGTRIVGGTISVDTDIVQTKLSAGPGVDLSGGTITLTGGTSAAVDYTAFEVVANDVAIPVGSTDVVIGGETVSFGVTVDGVTYGTAVQIPAGMVQACKLKTLGGKVTVDWGDGTKTERNDTVPDGSWTPEHTYTSPGKYLVKVFGAFSRIQTVSGKNLVHRVLGFDLPVASTHTNMQEFAANALRLVAVDYNDQMMASHIGNLIRTFSGCTNLRCVEKLNRLAVIASANGLFQNCYNMRVCEFVCPPVVALAADGGNGLRNVFQSTTQDAQWAIACDLNALFPTGGFAQEVIDLSNFFYNAGTRECFGSITLTAANAELLARKLWKSGKKFIGFEDLFLRLSAAVRAFIPTAWGGSDSTVVVDPDTGVVPIGGASVSGSDSIAISGGSASVKLHDESPIYIEAAGMSYSGLQVRCGEGCKLYHNNGTPLIGVDYDTSTLTFNDDGNLSAKTFRNHDTYYIASGTVAVAAWTRYTGTCNALTRSPPLAKSGDSLSGVALGFASRSSLCSVKSLSLRHVCKKDGLQNSRLPQTIYLAAMP